MAIRSFSDPNTGKYGPKKNYGHFSHSAFISPNRFRNLPAEEFNYNTVKNNYYCQDLLSEILNKDVFRRGNNGRNKNSGRP